MPKKILPKRIGIVGSRRRNTGMDQVLLQVEIDRIYKIGDIFVSGGCPRGADRMAEGIAIVRRIPIIIHEAKWEELGRVAGFVRNTLIARDSDVLIAMVAPDRTGGTEDTVSKMLALGKEVIYVPQRQPADRQISLEER